MTALIGAAISLVGLGFIMGFSPAVYALVLHLLATSKRALTSIRWMSLGLVIGALFLLLLFRVVDPQTLTTLLQDETKKFLVDRTVDGVASVAFVIGGLVMLSRLRLPRKDPRKKKPPKKLKPGRMIYLGIGESVISVSGLATTYVSDRVITAGTHHYILQGALAIVFLAAVVSQYLLLAWAWHAFPRLANWITKIYDRATRIDTRPWLTAGLFTAGVVFGAMAIWGH